MLSFQANKDEDNSVCKRYLDGDLCQISLIFYHDLIIYIDFTRIAALNTASEKTS